MSAEERLAALLAELALEPLSARQMARRLIAAGVSVSTEPGAPDPLREAAKAVVAAWVDDESGMATFDSAVIDRLAEVLEAE